MMELSKVLNGAFFGPEWELSVVLIGTVRGPEWDSPWF